MKIIIMILVAIIDTCHAVISKEARDNEKATIATIKTLPDNPSL